LIKKDIGHGVIPPVRTAAGHGRVQIDILLRPAIEIFFTQKHPIDAILAALIDAHQAGANDRRQDIDGFANALVIHANRRV